MVKPGDKQTEIGVIPEDWEAKPIGELANIRMCKRIFAEQTSDYGDIPFYKIGTFGGKPDAYISRALYNEYTSKYSYPEKGDILISAAGTLGRTVVFDGSESYFQDSNIVWLDIDKKQLCNEYLKQYYGVIRWAASEGSTISRLYNGIIESTYIAVPPLAEQQRIAEALSDMDELIASLEKLIAKKKAVKQGAMQELLTGKRRLPGFTGEWEDVALGDILDYEQPTNYIVKSTDYAINGTPVLTAGKSFILGYTNESKGIYKFTPVILFDDFITVSRYVDFPFKVKSSAVKLLKTKRPEDNLKLVYELMQMVDFQVVDHQRHWISQYSHINIRIPKEEEQKAISSVLSNMDSEIQRLERKLEKTTQIKQGMMQQLLTGKIRLV